MADSPRVTFNVSTAEKERTYTPFVAAFERPANWEELRATGKKPPADWHSKDVESRAVTMTDPAEIDWRDLLDIEKPIHFLKHCVTQEDRDFIKTCPIEGWRFGALIEAYQRHYGMDSAGNGVASTL